MLSFVVSSCGSNLFVVFDRLRLQLLGLWTANVKRVGKTLIRFMLLTVKNFDENEVSVLLN